ncbi:hypothetical protein llap_13507 [Limosa lapponica baueri]|uniref:DUF4592 domain-containing protein n=1 Tax=Limosa lapponica baueri TaxID=1758121 RepID=A0A2I0TQV1_LIMLA|nr:hypothetical protein llap_13507 [Limosa lapponica baueri]
MEHSPSSKAGSWYQFHGRTHRQAPPRGTVSDKKKAGKFQPFKKLFGRRKKREPASEGEEAKLKPSHSFGNICNGTFSSDEEPNGGLRSSHYSMGSRAFSHDSIFIPDGRTESEQAVQAMSQENVLGKVKTLQKRREREEQRRQELEEQKRKELEEKQRQELEEQKRQELEEKQRQELEEQKRQEQEEQRHQELEERKKQELEEQKHQEWEEQRHKELEEKQRQELEKQKKLELEELRQHEIKKQHQEEEEKNWLDEQKELTEKNKEEKQRQELEEKELEEAEIKLKQEKEAESIKLQKKQEEQRQHLKEKGEKTEKEQSQQVTDKKKKREEQRKHKLTKQMHMESADAMQQDELKQQREQNEQEWNKLEEQEVGTGQNLQQNQQEKSLKQQQDKDQLCSGGDNRHPVEEKLQEGPRSQKLKQPEKGNKTAEEVLAQKLKREVEAQEQKRIGEELRWQEVDERQTASRPFTFQVSSGDKQIIFQKVNLSPVMPAKGASSPSIKDYRTHASSKGSHALPSSVCVPHTAILVTGAQLCGTAVNLNQIKDTACKSLLGLTEERKNVDIPSPEKAQKKPQDPKPSSSKMKYAQEALNNQAVLAEWASIRSRILKNAENSKYNERDRGVLRPHEKPACKSLVPQKPALAPKPASQTPPSSPLSKMNRSNLADTPGQRLVKAESDVGWRKDDRANAAHPAPSHEYKNEEEEIREKKSFFPSISIPWREKNDKKPEPLKKEKPILQSRHSLDGSKLMEKVETSQPLWITLALQKQKGFREQQATREERRQAREAKQAEKLARENAALSNQSENKSSGSSKTSTLQKSTTQEGEKKIETAVSRLERREQLKKSNTLPTSVTVEISDSVPSTPLAKEVAKRFSTPDANPVSTEPAWLALAKRKAKAWSDCPQIIK